MIPKYSKYDPSIDRVKKITQLEQFLNTGTIQAFLWSVNEKKHINFCFKKVSIEETQKEILNSNNKKASQNVDIPTKIIKENSDIFGKVLCSFINDSIKSFTFPSCLKEADITPIHKEGKKDKKEN